MTIPKFAARRDKNEAEIINTMELAGASVLSLSSKGVPDLLVYFRGKHYLIEIKSSKGHLTKDQKVFHGKWKGPIHIVRSIDDALSVLSDSL